MRFLTVGSLLVLFLSATATVGQEREFRPRVVIPSERFKPIVKFPILTAKKAKIDDNELVLGVVVNGKARAYPINMLTGPSREILNDKLGGTAIAATW